MIRRGFTLVELLVVITIVATLAVLSYAGARRAIDAGRAAKSSVNLKNLVVANNLYAAENATFCPAADQFNTRRWHGKRTSVSAPFDPAKGLLSDYLGKSREVTVCPLFKAIATNHSSFENGTGGYGYNSQYIGGKPGGEYDSTTKLLLAERPANVEDADRTVMFTTTAYARAEGMQEYPTCDPPFWDFGDGNLSSRPNPTVHFRANGKALVAWCDGHVSAERPNDSPEGENPHGGDAASFHLGWFGPEENNGYWNTRKQR